MAVKSNTVKLNDRQWSNLIELNKVVLDAKDVFETANSKFQMWVEMQAEAADLDPKLKVFAVDSEKKTLTFSEPQEGPKVVK